MNGRVHHSRGNAGSDNAHGGNEQQIKNNSKYNAYDGSVEVEANLAYADAVLDKYEEYTIRKIAELIYVSHGDFIQAKMAVKNARNG